MPFPSAIPFRSESSSHTCRVIRLARARHDQHQLRARGHADRASADTAVAARGVAQSTRLADALPATSLHSEAECNCARSDWCDATLALAAPRITGGFPLTRAGGQGRRCPRSAQPLRILLVTTDRGSSNASARFELCPFFQHHDSRQLAPHRIEPKTSPPERSELKSIAAGSDWFSTPAAPRLDGMSNTPVAINHSGRRAVLPWPAAHRNRSSGLRAATGSCGP
jgi:hypothetical protein